MKDKLLRICLILWLLFIATVSADAAIFYIVNVNDSGAGSLRQAIIDANFHTGKDTIYFNLSGTAPFKIQPVSSYDVITSPLLIDGFSQPLNNDSVFSVVIDGSFFITHSPADFYLFRVNASRCEFRGIKISDLNTGIIGVTEMGPKAIDSLTVKRNYFTNCGGGVLSLRTYGVTQTVSWIHNVLVDSNFLFNTSLIGMSADHSPTSTVSSSPDNITNVTVSNNIVDSAFNGCILTIEGTAVFRGLIKNIYIKSNTFNNCTIPIVITAGAGGFGNASYSNINILNNEFTNSAEDVIRLKCIGTGNGNNYVDSLSIKNNIIHKAYGHGAFNRGIYFLLGGTGDYKVYLSSIRINNNTIDSVSNSILIDGQVTTSSIVNIDSMEINDNEITNADAGVKIYLYNESAVMSGYKNFNINNNLISNCNKEGISIQNIINGNNYTRSENFNITNNSISFCNESGIKLLSTSICRQSRSVLNYFNIKENILFNNGKYGIEQINYPNDTLCFTTKSLLADHIIISKNSIYDNGYKGISIQDISYNNYLFNSYEYPIPVLTYVNNNQLFGHINGEANTKYIFEFFTNQVPDFLGYGEGETFVGIDSVITDSSGFGAFTYSISTLNSSLYLSATATDQNHFNTSEFSNCISLTVGVNDLSFTENKILISPNPANSEAVFKAPGLSGSLCILNNVGQVIDRFEFKDEYKLSLEKYKSSLYLIKLYTDKNLILTGKLSVCK